MWVPSDWATDGLAGLASVDVEVVVLRGEPLRNVISGAY
jgi:hypothetical protein